MTEIAHESEKKEPKRSSIDEKIDEILIQKRRIFFSSAVTDESANEVIRKLWYLEASNP
ncbi:MAG: ATP-dependent Clp protease proteolytic subunit, partial [Simkaniaceae bacterium]|nr:ATP-dependent Clp protease proteolytic subunit [Simkaniaceae bacterium]